MDNNSPTHIVEVSVMGTPWKEAHRVMSVQAAESFAEKARKRGSNTRIIEVMGTLPIT